jgi:P27 family predicted phage terminase small subunit
VGRRGPKPAPKALRLLRHPVATTRTPAAAPVADPAVMPAGLSDVEQAAWAGLQAELAAVPGLACRADRGACELVARLEPALRAAAVVVREQGSTLTVYDSEGAVRFVQTRPEATFALKAAALLKTLYGELGLTPSGRSRVSLTPAPAASKLDRYLQGRHGT